MFGLFDQEIRRCDHNLHTGNPTRVAPRGPHRSQCGLRRFHRRAHRTRASSASWRACRARPLPSFV